MGRPGRCKVCLAAAGLRYSHPPGCRGPDLPGLRRKAAAPGSYGRGSGPAVLSYDAGDPRAKGRRMIELLSHWLIRNRENTGDPGGTAGLRPPVRAGRDRSEPAAVRRKAVRRDCQRLGGRDGRCLQQPVGCRLVGGDAAGLSAGGEEAGSTAPLRPRRIEYISGLVVSGLILLMGVELGKSSVEKDPAPGGGGLQSAGGGDSGGIHRREAVYVPV